MQSMIDTLHETQTILIEAGSTYANTYLQMLEKITQLNLDITRIAFERTAALSFGNLLAEQAEPR